MRSSTKRKRVGRPRASVRRPVLSARVPKEFHARILASAAISGRNASEELIWRAEQSYAWEETRGTIEAWLAAARRATKWTKKLPVNQMLQQWGFTKIEATDGGKPKWVITNEDAVRDMLELAARRELERMLKRS
jgi:hypothetical protein